MDKAQMEAAFDLILYNSVQVNVSGLKDQGTRGQKYVTSSPDRNEFISKYLHVDETFLLVFLPLPKGRTTCDGRLYHSKLSVAIIVLTRDM